MSTNPLNDLAARLALDQEQIAQLDALATATISLEISGTAIAGYADAVDRHLADSLAGLGIPEVQQARTLIDIGSGVGLPGLALAVARPDLSVTLVDSVRKKAEVAARIARKLSLENVESVWGRAEEVAALGGELRAHADVVSARALADLNVLLEYAAPLLRDGGSLVAWKGAPAEPEVAAAASAANQLGFEPPRYIEYQPFPVSEIRRFAVATRTGPLPDGYPRRPGSALRKPLGQR